MGVSRRRQYVGYTLALAGSVPLVACLVPARDTLNLASDMLGFLVLIVAVALVGGLGPALLTALLGAGLLNFWFTPPLHTLTVGDADDLTALIGFVLVALMVSWIVDLAERRQAAAAAAAELEAVDRLRTAILAAVGHDLRTPLATAKAVVSGLRSSQMALTPRDRTELLEAADGALDRLAGLVDNLLDMSRLNAGAMPLSLVPVAVDEVVARARDDAGVDPRAVVIEVDADLPLVLADAGLLERVLANLVANAQRYSPPGVPATVRAVALGARIEVSVVDHGPGVPAAEHEEMFLPFQRLGDTDNSVGLGLGLAVARGLAEAMSGSLRPLPTPGGGLTMLLVLRAEE